MIFPIKLDDRLVPNKRMSHDCKELAPSCSYVVLHFLFHVGFGALSDNWND